MPRTHAEEVSAMNARQLGWILWVGLLASPFTGACTAGEPPPDLPKSGAVIGPAGGTLVETENSEIAGLKITVLPGAWKKAWRVSLDYRGIFDTPNYPDGFVPFQRPDPSGSVAIKIADATTGLPPSEPLPMKISFPLDKIRPAKAELDVRSAFFYDRTQGDWSVVFPREATEKSLVVETSRSDLLWAWGYVSIGELDYDLYLKPAMDTFYGADVTAAIEQKFAQIRAEAEQRNWAYSCIGLAAAKGFVTGLKQEAYNNLDALQASYGCGPCNPLTAEFDEGFQKYWEVARWEIGLDVAGLMFPPKKALELVADPLLNVAQDAIFDALKPNTPCDYDCYFEHTDAKIYVLMAVYYGSDWVIKVIDWVRTDVVEPPCP
jgi:hypothetical protein